MIEKTFVSQAHEFTDTPILGDITGSGLELGWSPPKGEFARATTW